MLKSRQQNDTVTVFLTGELDHYSAMEIRRLLDTLIAPSKIRRLILNMQELQFMDSSGIGVILGRYRLLHSRGGSVSVTGMNPQIARIFQLSGMARIIPILADEEEAIV